MSGRVGHMPDFTKRVQKRLPLPDGEFVQQAAVAQPPGSFVRGVAERPSVMGGLLDAAVSKKGRSTNPDEGVIADRVPSKNGYFIVTNRRFLWAAQNRLGSVADITAEFRFDEVGAIELTNGGGMSNKLLNITFIDGSEVGLAVAKGQKPDLLAAAITASLADTTVDQ